MKKFLIVSLVILLLFGCAAPAVNRVKPTPVASSATATITPEPTATPVKSSTLGYARGVQGSSGTAVDDFSSLIGWNGGVLDTLNYKTGNAGIKLTTPIGGSFYIQKAGLCLNLSTHKNIGFWVYFYTEPTTTLRTLSVQFSSDIFASKSIRVDLTNNMFIKGWNYVRVSPPEWITPNGEAFSNTMNSIKVDLRAQSSHICIATISKMEKDIEGAAKCIITFDDIWNSAYTQGLAYMQQKGLRGVFYVSKNLIGSDSNHGNVSQLRDAYNKGWDIANHSETHTNFKDIHDINQIQTDYQNNINWLNSLGFTKSAYYVAYPGGGFNDEVLQAMNNLGVKTARTILSPKTVFPDEDLHLLRNYYVTNTKTLATIEGWIDAAIANNSTIILTFHKLVTTPTADIEWKVSDFHSLIDYIASKNITVVTMSEWYKNLN